ARLRPGIRITTMLKTGCWQVPAVQPLQIRLRATAIRSALQCGCHRPIHRWVQQTIVFSKAEAKRETRFLRKSLMDPLPDCGRIGEGDDYRAAALRMAGQRRRALAATLGTVECGIALPLRRAMRLMASDGDLTFKSLSK